MVTDKKLKIGKIALQPTDALILLTLIGFSLIAVIFHASVEQWWLLVVKNTLVAFCVLGSIALNERISHRFLKFSLRTAVVTLSFAYLFGAVEKLQLILHGEWLDPYVLDFEQYVFGVQPTLWLEQYTTPWLTEWMMFSYVIYVPLYPLLCGIIYYTRGSLQMEDYFFTLGLTNVLCDVGFILFPVASPMYFVPGIYSVPLDGYVFTYLGEFMRQYLHYIGGSIPSPHAAAATIIWMMAYRYHRPSFYVMIPIILSLYVATFYGRYHYLTDALVGIIIAFVALALVPHLKRLWENFANQDEIEMEQIS